MAGEYSFRGDAGRDPQVHLRLLEERVRSLRSGRQVLMQLLRRVEEQRRKEVAALEREVERLRRRNRHYAKLLWHRRVPS